MDSKDLLNINRKNVGLCLGHLLKMAVAERGSLVTL